MKRGRYLELEVLASVVTLHDTLLQTAGSLGAGRYGVGVVGVTLD